MSDDIESVKKSRSSTRGSFTKTYIKIDNLLRKESTDIDEITCLFELLGVRYVELDTKNTIIQDLMNKGDYKEDDYEKEQDTVDEYTLKYYKMKQLVDKLTVRSISSDSSSSIIEGNNFSNISELSCKYKYKLPPLKLKEFDGELGNWLPFWAQFEKINLDPKLTAGDRFQYLILATKPGSIAREVVDSYPATGDMYIEALNALKERFGRNDLLTEYYIRELLKIILQNTHSNKKMSVSSLYDKLHCHLKHLESLGVTSDNCAPILLPLVSSCLPEDLLKIWERDSVPSLKRSTPDVTSKDTLKNLLQFLKVEVEGQQKVALAMSGFGIGDTTHTNISRKKDSKPNHDKIPTAAGLLTTLKNDKGCIFCGNNHKSQDCKKAMNMTLAERRSIVNGKRACFCCLRLNHSARMCKNRPKCIICGKPHHIIVCDNISDNNKRENTPQKTNDNTQHDDALASLSNKCNVLLQTLVVKVRGKNRTRKVRVLIDSASQRTYILSSLAQEMGYEPCNEETISHSVFGDVSTGVIKHDVFTVYLSSLDEEYRCHFEALGQIRICGVISSVRQGPWIQELAQDKINLTDLGTPDPIEILIGADIAGKLFTGNRKQLESGLVALQTKLGWTLMGKMPDVVRPKQNYALIVTTLLTKEASLADLWALDTLGITDPSEKLRKTEIDAVTQQHFKDTVTITEEGRFNVHLPWVSNHPELTSNYELSLKRLQSTVKKLKNEGYYEAYQQVFNEWLSEGIIEEVPHQELQKFCHYMPHRHVVKTNSTTPIRPVFDASACEKRYPSLNQCLQKGPNLIEKIPSVLAKFRQKQIGIVGDIRRAFLQISVSEKDRDFLRFLWIDKNNTLKVYRHCRVVFGVSPSPFLLEASIKLHIENVLNSCKKGEAKWPIDIIKQLATSFYVDNFMTSSNTKEDAQLLINVASEVMMQRKFELRGWEQTDFEINVSQPTNVLGILWDRRDDTLSINVESLLSMTLEKITKRVILSAAHRLFDPIGITSGVVLIPKLLLQRTWELGLTWEQEVPDDIKKQFCTWLKDISYLSNLKIPRWISNSNTPNDGWSLHIFCDASRNAYAAVVFLRVELDDKVNVQLLTAKSKVAPIAKPNKNLTIPRLELLASSIAARLYRTIIDDYEFHGLKVTFWTDASTVLAWIQRKDPWEAFVANRIKEIRELTVTADWRHIPGADNPADLISRGCSAKKLVSSRWWEGPAWLRGNPELWPKSDVTYNEKEIEAERKQSVKSLLSTSDNSWYYEHFSQYKKLVRMIGWIYRWKKYAKLKKCDRIISDLTAQEYEVAEKKVLSFVQRDAFTDVFDTKLSSLLPFVDSEGVIRLMTKISHRDDVHDFCHPIVLPSAEHPVIFRLIMDVHKSNCHAGTQMVMTILRQQFWIMGGRRTIRTVINSCVQCRRHSSKRVEVEPSPLPEARVRTAKVFEVTGVDLAGPIFIKEGKDSMKKFWVCLFTCGVYRAIHLELVSSQSTDSFLQALRRFTSRRGRPKIMYSDRGTNFVGADNVLSKLDWNVIAQYSSVRKIEWRFNPPSSPWWGGWWERLIGILKNLLRRVLGRASVSYEEMLTILCDCESIINSRPLTYLSQDSSDLIPLTPSMFLQDVEEVGMPDLDLIEAADLSKRFEYRQHLKTTLRERFRSEYLGQLTLLANKEKKRILNVGEVVLIGNDDSKRMDWPLGRIMELIPGKDGHTRVVRLKTANGELVRPVQRIFPLELEWRQSNHNDQLIANRLRQSINEIQDEEDDQEEELPVDTVQATTRSGRIIKNPERLDL